MAPLTRLRTHIRLLTIAPELRLFQQCGGRWIGVEVDLQCTSDSAVFDRKFPGQEYLDVILTIGEVSRKEAAIPTPDYSVRLPRIKHHNRTSAQWNPVPCGWEMHIQTLVFTQKHIAKGRTAILCTVVVVSRAAADHQRDITLA